jgi:hypothetical protein
VYLEEQGDDRYLIDFSPHHFRADAKASSLPSVNQDKITAIDHEHVPAKDGALNGKIIATQRGIEKRKLKFRKSLAKCLNLDISPKKLCWWFVSFFDAPCQVDGTSAIFQSIRSALFRS